MIDLQTISVVIAATGVTIATIYYTLTLRNTQKVRELSLRAQEQALETRQAQFFWGLFEIWRSPEFRTQWHKIRALEWRDFNDFSEKYGEERDIEAISAFSSTMTFFEGIGVLVKRKLIDISLVHDLLATSILWTWEQYEPIFKGDREYFQRPQMWDDFESLYNMVKKIEQEPSVTNE